jgi:prophage maintenance system killer protein
MPDTKEQRQGEIVIYKDSSGPELKVTLENETIWLTQNQISSLFNTERSVITKHLRNVFNSAELSQDSVCANFAHTASDGKRYKVQYYNLDAVIAVGYRVNSKRATQFRMWATRTLRDYILKGFIVNQERLKEQSQAKLKELEGAVRLLQRTIATRKTVGLEKEFLAVITEYASTWTTLVQFDEKGFPKEQVGKRASTLKYEHLLQVVSQFSERLGQNHAVDPGFGQEKGNVFKKTVQNVNSHTGSVADVGALLFYTIVKEQPFTAGNKQIASLVLLIYLVHNNFFYNRKGERKLDDATLVALSVLVEESSSQDKSIMLQLIASMINQK